MTPPDLRPVDAHPIRREALDTVQQLKEALAAHDITLPSLDVDPPSYARLTGRPLIELGRCNQETARLLTDMLNRAKEMER